MFHTKLVLFMLVPPILAACFAGVWFAVFRWRQDRPQPLSRKRAYDLFTVSCVVTMVLGA